MNRNVCFLVLMGFGCESSMSTLESDSDVTGVQATSGEFVHSNEWASNFPAEADLAILLDTQDEPLIDFETRTEFGERLLPRLWLNSVKKSYTGTFAEDAFDDEHDQTSYTGVELDQVIKKRIPAAARPLKFIRDGYNPSHGDGILINDPGLKCN